ncbi:MAG: glycosyltransferase, partial [bacterium]|nr:glycosyltransferase [bacterium]
MVGRILPLAQEVRVAGHGHVVDILTLSGASRRPYVESREVEGVRIRTVGPALRATDDHHPNPVRALPRFLAGQSALTRALSTRKADVIVLAKPQPQNTFPVLSWAEQTATPLIVDLDDRETEASRLPASARGVVAHLETQAIQHAAAITAASPALVEYARTIHPSARVELLPTGIRVPPTIPPARLHERLALPPDAKLIAYVGSLSVSSGHRVDTLLEAFNELADPSASAHLVLAGDGIDLDQLRKRAEASP